MNSLPMAEGGSLAFAASGDGAPILLIHGWMMSGAVWSPVAAALRAAGLRTIVPDLRGGGRSSKAGPYTLAQHAKDLEALVEHLGLDTFHVAGHSMGGQVAQLLAADLGARVDALVLVNSVPAAGLPLPDEARSLFRSSGGNAEAQRTILRMACLELGEDDTDALLAIAGTVDPGCIAESFDAWTAGGIEDRLGDVQARTLVLGTDDPFLPPELLRSAIVDHIASARLEHLTGPGHYPLIERPAATAKAIARFVAG